MKNLSMIAFLIVFTALTGSAIASEMGVSQGRDLDALWARAQANHDLENEDAVILLESRAVTLNPDGTRSTRIHRTVWIGTALGIRSYADLRVPWDMATSTLEVEVLRSWMDDRWWPDPERISDTAVVHTLPHALRTAHDYTTMRETMLLHDGVELPCIMETAYTITEKMAFDHTDGLFVMPQRDPAVRVELKVSAPAGVEVMHEAMNGVSEPVVDNANGQLVVTWALDDVAPLKWPIAAPPERYEPSVVWSTWPDWGTVGQAWRGSLESVTALSPGLQDSLHVLVADRSGFERQVKVFADWVDEKVRPVRYGPGFWFGRARPAAVTFESGYGHALDRAVLFAALYGQLREGLPVFFVGQAGDPVAPAVPRMNGLGTLLVGHPQQESLYDAAHGALVNTVSLRGRTAFLFEDYPVTLETRIPVSDSWMLSLAIEPQEDGIWSGEGGFVASGIFADYTQLADGPDAAVVHLGSILGAALPGAETTSVNPVKFDGEGQSFTMAFDLPALEEDGHGLTRLVIGSAGRGIGSRLPGDVHLTDQVRTSPVIGLPMSQMLRVRIKGTGMTAPEAIHLSNEAGVFSLRVTEEYGWTTIDRELQLKKDRYEACDWPALRALLLEEQDPRHGTVLFD